MMKPQDELQLRDELERERELSDLRYAEKLVEKIVYRGISFVLLAVLGALLALVIINK